MLDHIGLDVMPPPPIVATANQSDIYIPMPRSLSFQQQSMTLGNMVDDMDDQAIYDTMDDATFTDIFLDWESMRGSVPEWT